jgi:hypothetical protein
MLFASMLDLGHLQTKPQLVAVQRWNKDGPVKAWTVEGKPLASLITVDRADWGLPDKPGATEIIMAFGASPTQEFPDAYWTDVNAFDRQSCSTSLKDHDPKSGVALLSLLGFSHAKEASGVLHIASGPMIDVVGPKTLRLNQWTKLEHGFLAQIRNRFYNEEDADHVKHAYLEIVLPEKYRQWDVHPIVKSKGQEDAMVDFDVSGTRGRFKLETGVSSSTTLTISVRPYVAYPFSHVPLRPR